MSLNRISPRVIRKIIRAGNFTQGTLAEALHRRRETVNAWLKRGQRPDAESYHKLCRLYDKFIAHPAPPNS